MTREASFAARWAAASLRATIKPIICAATDFQETARTVLDYFPIAPAQGAEPRVFGGVAGEWRSAPGRAAATLLYLHGGAYFAGSAALYRPVTRFFADEGFDVFAPDYRLAPKHPFPAALEDALAAWRALAAERGGPIVVAGDSAGGGLALALLVALRDAGEASPAAAALFSPWTDLAVTGASARENEESDALFTRRLVRLAGLSYLAGANARDPRASPLYADMRGLPPLLIHVGADELLRDDSSRVAEKAAAAGVSVDFKTWPGAPHGWQLGVRIIPEARESLRLAAAFLRRAAEADGAPAERVG